MNRRFFHNIGTFLILVALNLILCSHVNSQAINESEYEKEIAYPLKARFERVASGNGSTKYTSTCVIQDKSGFIWFATPNLGGIKYDGYGAISSENLTPDSKKAATATQTLFCDSDSNIWMGGYGELVEFNIQKNSLTSYNVGSYFDRTIVINSILDYKDGQLILATDKGLKLFDKDEKKFKNLIHTAQENLSILNTCQCSSMIFDEFNNLWIGTGEYGIFVLSPGNSLIRNYKHDVSNPSSLSYDGVSDICIDSKNNIWVGTWNGLNFFEKKSDNFRTYHHNKNDPESISENGITSICEDKDGNIWIGTFSGGLNKLKADATFTKFEPDKNDPNSLPHMHIYDLCADNSNVLWVCTLTGVCKLDLRKKKFYTLSNTFQTEDNKNQKIVNCVYVDSADYLWTGIGYNGGIYKFKREGNYLKFIDFLFISDPIKNTRVTNAVIDEELNLWFTNNGGMLMELNEKNNKFSVYSAQAVLLSLVAYDNNLLLGTDRNGLVKFNLVKREFEPIENKALEKLSEISVQTLFLDKANNLWIGTTGEGLYRFEIDKDTVIHYHRVENDSNSLSSSIISSIIEDSNQNLWFGTGMGICRFNKANDNFIRYSIAGSGIRGMQIDNSGKFWLASASLGICSFDPEKRITTEYTFDEGPQVFNIRTCERDNEGYMYFGTLDGLTYFNPDEIEDNPYTPNIVLTDFRISNETVNASPENSFLKKSITVAKEIDLTYKENVFSFEFAALIYNNPSKNQYAYKMEGFDKDWVYCGTKRTATYTNLDPGEYTFRVKGSNNDGVWNEEGASVKVTITPPWWQTWWFKSCGAAMILVTAGYGYRKRINNLKREKKLQEDFSKKLLNSQEEERKKIASVLHDSIAHEVLITKNASVLGLKSPDEKEKDKALGEISLQSTSTLNELRRIQFTLHPYEIEKLGLTKAIKSIIDRVSKNTGIKFLLEEDIIDNVFSEENEIHLYRIIQEAINNIIKHSSATEALIKISRTEENVFITISDNGKGFVKRNAMRKNSMGLSGMSERVRLLGGTMEIDSEGSSGTMLRINLPVSDLRF